MLSSLEHLESKMGRFLKQAGSGKPILLYGAGSAMPSILDKLEDAGFSIAGICDSNPAKHGTRFRDTYDIFALNDALGRFPDATFVISTPVYFDEIYQELVQKTDPDRVSDLDFECTRFFKTHELRNFVFRHQQKLEALLSSLADDASRDALMNVIKAHLTGDRKDFQRAYTGKDDWYLFRSLLAPPAEAVYLDCGAYNGDTVRLFIETASKGYGHIYVFEPDDAMRLGLRHMASANPRISLIEKGVFREEGVVSFCSDGVFSAISTEENAEAAIRIPVTTIDAVLNGARADIIKMDIEGAEFDALRGAEQTIRAHKPKLAVCLYHKVEDMLRIPELLREYVPDYKLYIRHQSTTYTDTILFAVAQ
ncbi:FkbM family methyltransferase [uncultured Hyphomicrobium sp.]|uniref:FkbM family methyltransferase n=1 Tax=uncultured Hyphomicrobium sp. TaxID=194373 RepID=UPI0025E1000E|nr:FkbM family methyltransferase [uncultured Hyphomicrobium sp.]